MSYVYILTEGVYTVFDVIDWLHTLPDGAYKWTSVIDVAENVIKIQFHEAKYLTMFGLVWAGQERVAIISQETLDDMIAVQEQDTLNGQ